MSVLPVRNSHSQIFMSELFQTVGSTKQKTEDTESRKEDLSTLEGEGSGWGRRAQPT